MLKVVCFGEAFIDLLSNSIEPPVSANNNESFKKFPGGAPANVAVVVSKLGGTSYFVGKLAKDNFGEYLHLSLAKAGVNLDYTKYTSDAKTALAYVSLDKEGERSFSFSRDNTADLMFEPVDFSEECFNHNGIFHFCSNTFTHHKIFQTTKAGISKAKSAGMLVSFDVNLRLNLWPVDRDPLVYIWSVVEQAHILKMSADELIFICAGEDESKVIKRLIKAGVKLIVITNGGLLIRYISQYAQGEFYPPKVSVVDSTAAGDAFIGGLLYQLAFQSISLNLIDKWLSEAESLNSAIEFASACGAITVTREGAFDALPYLSEVIALPRNYSPGFKNKSFLLGHIGSIMDFYHSRCVDQKIGGFIQHFRDDGSVYDFETRHLVSSTRFIFNYSMAAKQFNDENYLTVARHGVDFLRQVHRNQKTGGYAWIMKGREIKDSTNYCYGLAFVLLAYSTSYKAGFVEAKAYIGETCDLMDKYFWIESDGLYCDEISADWSNISDYRGQNANMHSCEALIMAYEATQEKKYLQRAYLIAKNICQRQACLTDGLIWEHYDSDWQIDWQYNKNCSDDLFRPWGFQIGHLTEWAKLLLIIERHIKEEWLVTRAIELFDVAMKMGWDSQFGGLYYGADPDGMVCDSDKYFWVQAESIAAAALLARRTGNACYWQWYNRIWAYSWRYMVDHEYGAWFRILSRNNRKYDNLKSPAGKTDYHTMGACYEVLNVL